MEVQKDAGKKLQWHPAFYAGIQIELKDEAENLIFENEHQLGTKPFGIDVLIIKKESEKPIRKNIGRIFRKHNIIEYKSPTDYLNIDDFYKVYGYACFYKADVEKADSIKVEELTISLVCYAYPRKLFKHLQKKRNYTVQKVGQGIYYVIGDKFPIQILITGKLSEKDNLWLKSITNQLEDAEEAKALLADYEKNRGSNLYKSVMNMIIQANIEKFREVKSMCEALEELMKEEFEAKRKEGETQGEIRGEIRGTILGKNQINELNQRLAKAGRVDDILKAAEDKEYQEKLIKEFGL